MRAPEWWARLAEVSLPEQAELEQMLAERWLSEVEQVIAGRPDVVDENTGDRVPLRLDHDLEEGEWPYAPSAAAAPLVVATTTHGLPSRVVCESSRALFMRATADRLDRHADRQPLSAAKRTRAEAAALRARADEVDDHLDTLPDGWAEPRTPGGGQPPLIPLQLRSR